MPRPSLSALRNRGKTARLAVLLLGAACGDAGVFSPPSPKPFARAADGTRLATALAPAFSSLASGPVAQSHAVTALRTAAAEAQSPRVVLPAGARTATVSAVAPLAELDPRYLSFAIDTSQVVGGLWWEGGGERQTTPFDFSRPALLRLTQALAPALLRIGGTAADQTFYDLDTPPRTSPPADYRYLLTRREFDGLGQFAQAAGLDLLFTLNAGGGPRRPQLLGPDSWSPEQAKLLVDYAVAQHYPVAAWELGNEINAFPLALHLFSIGGARYAADAAVADQLLASDAPGSVLAGPASAFWPRLGEANALLSAFLTADAEAGGQLVDPLTWHYYPQQGSRCPVATVAASPTAMLDPRNLDEVRGWAQQILASQRRDAPRARVWLGETGNAQCGGEPGVSDTFASSFWWLDQLGLLAQQGVGLQVRQTLVGSDYGLLDDDLHPRPDYWASLLWKQTMGTRVLATRVDGPPTLRVYAQCAAELAEPGAATGAVTVLAINLSTIDSETVSVAGVGGTQVDRFLVTATGLGATEVLLNGEPLALPSNGPPALRAAHELQDSPFVALPPTSYAFLHIRDAQVAVCQ